ncbi:MAG: phosphatidylserine decarboxylase [Chloroflexota bacterium]
MNHYGTDRWWPFAEGGGTTIVLVSAVYTAAHLLHKRTPSPLTRALSWLMTGLWLLILYFFRDPNRRFSGDPALFLSPGDGEIVDIVQEREERYLQTDVVRISIFLSIFDVHVQRVPIAGRVTAVDHRPGQFLQAFKPEASAVNEYIAMQLETDFGPVLIKQIAGILARRCVNYLRPGQRVARGQRLGLIKFSSRVDIFLPHNAQLLVSVGDKVYGGLTPVARLTK